MLLSAPAFRILVVTTCGAVRPWLLLRKVPLMVERPSSHVTVLHSTRIWIRPSARPALGDLLAGQTPSQLVWATRDPAKTYGAALVDEILTAQPEAIIWNTDELVDGPRCSDSPTAPTSPPAPKP